MSLDSDTAVYLTGGTGFIGSHLRSALADRGVTVTLLVRENRPVETRETERIQRGDVTTPETISLAGHDIAIHLAARTSVEESIENPRRIWEINADGTLNVLEAARKADIDRFLYASTASIYGPPAYLPIDESHPTNPIEPYGASKLAGDGISRSYTASYGLDTVVTRIFNAFGPRQANHNVVPTIISQALTDGQVELGNLSPSRDFIYITDVINALITVLVEGESATAYNVGRGESVSVGDLAEMVVDTAGQDVDIVSTAERQRSDDVEIPKHVADVSRLRDLGWDSKYSVREGIKEIVEQATE